MHVCAVDEAHVGKLGYMVGKKLQAVASPSAGNRESRRGCLVKLSGIAVQGMVKKEAWHKQGYEKAQPLGVVWC